MKKDLLQILYDALTQYKTVYLFYLVPIAYFLSIVARLVYYKLKYHKKLFWRDLMSVVTMLIIGADYINYLYLLISGTGEPLPKGALFLKYTFGFLLWVWMFWYSYQVHLKKGLSTESLKKKQVIVACLASMFIILVVIVLVMSF